MGLAKICQVKPELDKHSKSFLNGVASGSPPHTREEWPMPHNYPLPEFQLEAKLGEHIPDPGQIPLPEQEEVPPPRPAYGDDLREDELDTPDDNLNEAIKAVLTDNLGYSIIVLELAAVTLVHRH